MKNLFAVTIVLAAILGVSMSTAEPTAGVEWKSVTEALESAPKQNKKIVLDVYTDWCGWCKRMDKDTYADSAVAAYMAEHYVASKMNPEKAGELTFDNRKFTQAEFGAALEIRGYPATAFFNEQGELLTVVGGYLGPKDFLKVLKFFGEDAYKTQSWEEFAKANP
jgi:thioredoxin-related protein